MKYLLVLLVSLVSFANVQAQGFSLASTSTSATTVENITIAGKVFQGGLSSTGSTWIMRTSKKGNEYKSYIGTDTGKVYDSKAVYTANVKGEARYFFFSIGSTGYPKRNYLVMD